MKQRQFNGSDRQVSEVGLGCWQLGGDWGDVGEEEAMAILHAATEAGITLFDTADVYGEGRSETLIGRFLHEHKEPVFVATKMGRFPQPGWPGNFTWDAMQSHTEASLRRLGVSALDLTQLHCVPTEELRRGDVFESLRRLQRDGKIKQFGASVESMEEAHLCLAQEGLSSLQIIFNIFRQKPIKDLFEQARRQNIALIVRLPLASGLLSGKYRRDTQFPENDHRNFNKDGQAFNVGETFAGLPFPLGVELADAIKPLVPSGMTMAQMALRWCLDHEAVTAIIPGAKNPAMAQANAAAGDLTPLPPSLHEALREFYSERVAAHIRGPY